MPWRRSHVHPSDSSTQVRWVQASTTSWSSTVATLLPVHVTFDSHLVDSEWTGRRRRAPLPSKSSVVCRPKRCLAVCLRPSTEEIKSAFRELQRGLFSFPCAAPKPPLAIIQSRRASCLIAVRCQQHTVLLALCFSLSFAPSLAALSEDEPRSHELLNGLAGYLSALLFVRSNTRE